MSEKNVSKKALEQTDEASVDEKLDKHAKGEEGGNNSDGGENMKEEDKKPEEVESEVKDADEVKDAPEEVDDDEKRSGLKEVANNSDVMAIEKDKKVDGDEALPSFFVEKEDRHDVEVDILASKNDGKIVSISRHGLGLDFEQFDYLHHSVAKFEFSVPTYDEMSTYRQRSAAFRNDVQQMVVDRVQLRNFFLVWHLKDWSLKNRDGSKVELEHDDDGSLSDASMKKVYSVQPTLIDIVLTLFEKDILLT